ncbi:hypothetical protein DM860_013109 [Cuscuta australis]|uniref:Uncharacterized protein n=1 Tax=Cuscuta australis TaxID=267555 RepID=A0A328D775_9ASTE|nr:hypothetical protein DM860_013109 [Cuscuta australis]
MTSSKEQAAPTFMKMEPKTMVIRPAYELPEGYPTLSSQLGTKMFEGSSNLRGRSCWSCECKLCECLYNCVMDLGEKCGFKCG